MRYAIFADIHGNYRALKQFFSETRGFDKYFCLGDIVHNGRSFEENRCIDLVREHNAIVVRGNHESNVLDKGWNNLELKKILNHNLIYLANLPEEVIDGKNKLIHAPSHRTGLDWEIISRTFANLEREVEICFFGHTHQPAIYCTDGRNKIKKESSDWEKVFLRDGHQYLINPGTLGLGQGRNGTYLVLDENIKELQFKKLNR